MDEEKIFNEFNSRSLVKGNELYLNKEDSLSLILSCDKKDLAIIGIEIIELHNNNIYPLSEKIADFSSIQAKTWREFKQKSLKYTEEFLLKEMDKKKYLANYVFYSNQEWKNKINLNKKFNSIINKSRKSIKNKGGISLKKIKQEFEL